MEKLTFFFFFNETNSAVDEIKQKDLIEHL